MAMARRWTPQRFVTLRRIRVIAYYRGDQFHRAGLDHSRSPRVNP